MAVVLDTRFLIAHTFPSTTGDRDKIASFAARVATEGLLASSLSIAEFVNIAGARIGKDGATTRLIVWKKGGLEFVPISEEIGFRSGEMAQSHPDVPLGDVVIAATARAASATVATDDPHYRVLGVKTLWFR